MPSSSNRSMLDRFFFQTKQYTLVDFKRLGDFLAAGMISTTLIDPRVTSIFIPQKKVSESSVTQRVMGISTSLGRTDASRRWYLRHTVTSWPSFYRTFYFPAKFIEFYLFA